MRSIKTIIFLFAFSIIFFPAISSDTTKNCDHLEKGKKYDCLLKLKAESIRLGTKENTKIIKKKIKETKKIIK